MRIHYLQNGFEPQVHFTKKGQEFNIRFEDEWVHSTEEGLKFFDKEKITEVSSEPFLDYDVTYTDTERRRTVSFTKEFANKFGINIERKTNDIDVGKSR